MCHEANFGERQQNQNHNNSHTTFACEVALSHIKFVILALVYRCHKIACCCSEVAGRYHKVHHDHYEVAHVFVKMLSYY
jgi:hypothetical protein